MTNVSEALMGEPIIPEGAVITPEGGPYPNGTELQVSQDGRVSKKPERMTANDLLYMALERGMSADVLGQMMDMRDREEARHARLAFTSAMSRAKAELRPIQKTGEVDYQPQGKQRVHYKHETLAGIEQQTAEVLSRHGLSYRYELDNGIDKPITVTCVLEHVDGHQTRTPLSAGADTSGGKNSHQSIASAVTYLQRYTLKAALGLSVAADNDGTVIEHQGGTDTITPAQEAVLRDTLTALKADVAGFLANMKVERLIDIPAGQYEMALGLLKRKQERMKEQGQL